MIKYLIIMKNYFLGFIGLLILGSFSSDLSNETSDSECDYNRDSMLVVMRFEIKVKPEYVALLKQSFDACKVEVLAKEPGCLDYSLFQSYNDSTRFCITETWANKNDHNTHMKLEHTQKHLAETRGIHDPSFKSASNYVYWICPGANEK